MKTFISTYFSERSDRGLISIVNELTIEINVIVLSVSNKEVFNITRSGGQRLDSF